MNKTYIKSIIIFILSTGLAIFGVILYFTKTIELSPMSVILAVAGLLICLGIVETVKTATFNKRMKKLLLPENKKYYPVREFFLPKQAFIGEMIPKDVRQIKLNVNGHIYESEWYSLEEFRKMGITTDTKIALYADTKHPDVYFLDLKDRTKSEN